MLILDVILIIERKAIMGGQYQTSTHIWEILHALNSSDIIYNNKVSFPPSQPLSNRFTPSTSIHSSFIIYIPYTNINYFCIHFVKYDLV